MWSLGMTIWELAVGALPPGDMQLLPDMLASGENVNVGWEGQYYYM